MKNTDDVSFLPVDLQYKPWASLPTTLSITSDRTLFASTKAESIGSFFATMVDCESRVSLFTRLLLLTHFNRTESTWLLPKELSQLGCLTFFVSIFAIFGISTDTSLFQCVTLFVMLKAPRVYCFWFLLSFFLFITILATKRN